MGRSVVQGVINDEDKFVWRLLLTDPVKGTYSHFTSRSEGLYTSTTQF